MPLITAHDRTVPVTVQTRSTLSPADAFRFVVPIDLSLVFTGWGPFPGISGVADQTAAWDHAGPSRSPRFTDGTTARETLTEYDEPSSFAYEVTGFTNVLRHLVAGVRGEWTFAPDGTGTLVRWTYEFLPLPHRDLLVRRVLGPLWRNYMTAGVVASARAAERIDREERARPAGAALSPRP
ncbi:SRPBCC family protein [Modestobacter roseus]|uniref:Polyketide cyclase/dehydrase/lipid transport protein n=1 Tax=Modestobacter roseus TaxID=1181884 RepID=A0A562IQL6_9ACTN|nr:SRPBCC family protein [Modestobacter roseus]MQA32129.1 SRPBCC family protein [Modestobacter roseus]TWH73339.1 polyketide cyclase/dehydrase/lipid transport protein [Modestobacter roseus]